jgi:hypothetical protein
MESFARDENFAIPQLNAAVRGDLHRLRDLTSAFVAAEKDLEGDNFAAASRFIPHLLQIRKTLDQFFLHEPDVLRAVDDYIHRLQTYYANEWHLLIVMTYLNPSLQWEIGRICTQEEFSVIIAIRCRKRSSTAKIAPLSRIGRATIS